MHAQSYPFLQNISPLCLKYLSTYHQAHLWSNFTPISDTFIIMPSRSSTPHAHLATMADGSTDTPSANTQAQSQSQPLPSHHAHPPTHFTAGNSFGPYLFIGLTTNRPHPELFDSLSNPALVKLDVPPYLHYNHSYTHKLPHSNTTIDSFRFYLCASLARHHSYKKAYLQSATTAATRSYRKSYLNFTIHFTKALQATLNNETKTKTPKQQNDLVSLERTLTHSTFALWPHPFDRPFITNSILLTTTTVLNVLALVFLHSLKSPLVHAYLDLANAADILDPRHRRYAVWCAQECQRVHLLSQFDVWIADVQGVIAAGDDGARRLGGTRCAEG